MKKIFVTFILTVTILSAQSNPLTLDECLEIGLKSSNKIRIAEYNIIYSNSRISEIKSQQLPQVSLTAQYSRLSDIPPFEVSVPVFEEKIKIQDPILNNYGVQAGVRQIIFSGFKLSSLISGAQNLKISAEIDYQRIKNEVSLDIQKAYWILLKSQKYLNYVQENLNRMYKHLENTKKFLESGLATKNDLLKLEVQVSSSELKKIEAEKLLSISRSSLNKELGLPLNYYTTLKEVEFYYAFSAGDFNEIIAEALNNREELKSSEYKIESHKSFVNAEKSGRYPQIIGFVNYYYSNPNQRILPLQDTFIDTWDVGVSLRWNIWDWGTTSSRVEQSKQGLNQAVEYNVLLKETIQLEVYNNFLQLEYQLKKIEISKTALKSAIENHRITNKKYNQQLFTSTDLIDSELERLKTETDFLNARIDYKITEVVLLKSIGRKLY
ncbi:TolC family protein [Bacteroidota bacterium]